MSKGGDNMNSNNLGSIEKRLLEDPQTSNRLIGAQLKLSDRTVAKVRRELETAARIPVVTHTRGSDGRLRPRKHSRQAVQPKSTAQPEIFRTTRTRYGPKRTAPRLGGTVLGDVRSAFSSHPLAFIVALPFGGFVPVAVWCLTHLEPMQWWTWGMVAGGALFSSLTVISWGQIVLKNLFKAIGFATLVEGVMIASKTWWLSFTALGLLVTINAISCAVALAQDETKKQNRSR